MNDQIADDVDAFLRTIDETAEAEVVRELLAIAAEVEVASDADDYTPFVYPH